MEEFGSSIRRLTNDAIAEIAQAGDENQLREVELQYLGKKGKLTAILRSMTSLAPDDRPSAGRLVNEASRDVRGAIEKRASDLAARRLLERCEDLEFDATLPVDPPRLGLKHPITEITERVEDIFGSMGFNVLDYPELESEFFNFDALNIPAIHPAREMQDTFWFEDGKHLMRTHTSAGQVRAMREIDPPFRAIFPGKVFRYERTDASHEHTFHQVEGLVVDRNLSVANLIHAMQVLLASIFGRSVEIRLRPGYFPFVEPGFELDIRCQVCSGAGCPVCKHTSWVELLPCGLVHPNVLRFGGLDPLEWTGWAFGLGLSRLAMMKYQIDDVRRLLGGELRFLRQFRKGV